MEHGNLSASQSNGYNVAHANSSIGQVQSQDTTLNVAGIAPQQFNTNQTGVVGNHNTDPNATTHGGHGHSSSVAHQQSDGTYITPNIQDTHNGLANAHGSYNTNLSGPNNQTENTSNVNASSNHVAAAKSYPANEASIQQSAGRKNLLAQKNKTLQAYWTMIQEDKSSAPIFKTIEAFNALRKMVYYGEIGEGLTLGRVVSHPKFQEHLDKASAHEAEFKKKMKAKAANTAGAQGSSGVQGSSAVQDPIQSKDAVVPYALMDRLIKNAGGIANFRSQYFNWRKCMNRPVSNAEMINFDVLAQPDLEHFVDGFANYHSSAQKAYAGTIRPPPGLEGGRLTIAQVDELQADARRAAMFDYKQRKLSAQSQMLAQGGQPITSTGHVAAVPGTSHNASAAPQGLGFSPAGLDAQSNHFLNRWSVKQAQINATSAAASTTAPGRGLSSVPVQHGQHVNQSMNPGYGPPGLQSSIPTQVNKSYGQSQHGGLAPQATSQSASPNQRELHPNAAQMYGMFPNLPVTPDGSAAAPKKRTRRAAPKNTKAKANQVANPSLDVQSQVMQPPMYTQQQLDEAVARQVQSMFAQMQSTGQFPLNQNYVQQQGFVPPGNQGPYQGYYPAIHQQGFAAPGNQGQYQGYHPAVHQQPVNPPLQQSILAQGYQPSHPTGYAYNNQLGSALPIPQKRPAESTPTRPSKRTRGPQNERASSINLQHSSVGPTNASTPTPLPENILFDDSFNDEPDYLPEISSPTDENILRGLNSLETANLTQQSLGLSQTINPALLQLPKQVKPAVYSKQEAQSALLSKPQWQEVPRKLEDHQRIPAQAQKLTEKTTTLNTSTQEKILIDLTDENQPLPQLDILTNGNKSDTVPDVGGYQIPSESQRLDTLELPTSPVDDWFCHAQPGATYEQTMKRYEEHAKAYAKVYLENPQLMIENRLPTSMIQQYSGSWQDTDGNVHSGIPASSENLQVHMARVPTVHPQSSGPVMNNVQNNGNALESSEVVNGTGTGNSQLTSSLHGQSVQQQATQPVQNSSTGNQQVVKPKRKYTKRQKADASTGATKEQTPKRRGRKTNPPTEMTGPQNGQDTRPVQPPSPPKRGRDEDEEDHASKRQRTQGGQTVAQTQEPPVDEDMDFDFGDVMPNDPHHSNFTGPWYGQQPPLPQPEPPTVSELDSQYPQQQESQFDLWYREPEPQPEPDPPFGPPRHGSLWEDFALDQPQEQQDQGEAPLHVQMGEEVARIQREEAEEDREPTEAERDAAFEAFMNGDDDENLEAAFEAFLSNPNDENAIRDYNTRIGRGG